MKYTVLINLAIFIFIGCSSSKETTKEITSENKTMSKVTSKNLLLKIPDNWREINDNYNPLFEIWLINNDKNSVIGFIPIHFSDEIENYNVEEKIDMIEKLIIAKKKNVSDKLEILKKNSIIFKYPNKSFSYNIDNQFQSSIIFGNGNVFYECIAYFDKSYAPELEEIDNLINIQYKLVSESRIK